MMPAHELRRIQKELSDAIGKRVSDGDLGDALGLEPKNSSTKVRHWKADGPTGPASIALGYLAGGLPNARGEAICPEYVLGSPMRDTDMLYIVRLRFPRFVGWIDSRMNAKGSGVWIDINRHLRLTVTQWIDDLELAAFGPAVREALLTELAAEIDAELQRRERG